MGFNAIVLTRRHAITVAGAKGWGVAASAHGWLACDLGSAPHVSGSGLRGAPGWCREHERQPARRSPHLQCLPWLKGGVPLSRGLASEFRLGGKWFVRFKPVKLRLVEVARGAGAGAPLGWACVTGEAGGDGKIAPITWSLPAEHGGRGASNGHASVCGSEGPSAHLS